MFKDSGAFDRVLPRNEFVGPGRPNYLICGRIPFILVRAPSTDDFVSSPNLPIMQEQHRKRDQAEHG